MGEDENEDGECDEVEQERRTRAIVSQETANILSGLGKLSLSCHMNNLTIVIVQVLDPWMSESKGWQVRETIFRTR